MPSPDESKDEQPSEPTELQAWLRAWIYDWVYLSETARQQRNAETERLRKVIEDIAAQLDEEELPCGFSKEDLASDYFAWLKANGKGKDSIKYKAGLKTDFLRFLNKECNKPREELVTLLSDALKELFRQGKVRRLDADGLAKRSPVAEWALTRFGESPKQCDLRSFLTEAKKVEAVPPPSSDRLERRVATTRRADGVYACFACPHQMQSAAPPQNVTAHEHARRVISPKRTEELALQLLECTDGWIFFCDLFDEFVKRVHFFQTIGVERSSPDRGENLDSNDRLDGHAHTNEPLIAREMAPETGFQLLRIAKTRAAAIIAALETAAHNGRPRLAQILCCYIIPNRIRHEVVPLRLFGTPGRVYEQVQRICNLVRKNTPLDEDFEPDAEYVVRNESDFVALLFHCLEQWCVNSAGKVWKCPLQ